MFQNLGPEGARIGELANRRKLTNQSVGYLVDYLEEHGYVERRPDPRTGAPPWCASPERGWDEADACAKILDQLDQELMKRMGTERLEQRAGPARRGGRGAPGEQVSHTGTTRQAQFRHPAPSGAVRQPPRGASRDVPFTPTPNAVDHVAGPDAQNRTICTL